MGTWRVRRPNTASKEMKGRERKGTRVGLADGSRGRCQVGRQGTRRRREPGAGLHWQGLSFPRGLGLDRSYQQPAYPSTAPVHAGRSWGRGEDCCCHSVTLGLRQGSGEGRWVLLSPLGCTWARPQQPGVYPFQRRCPHMLGTQAGAREGDRERHGQDEEAARGSQRTGRGASGPTKAHACGRESSFSGGVALCRELGSAL